MNESFDNAADAIRASAQSGAIVRCADTPGNRHVLLVECTDSVDTDTESEYWGQDAAGTCWRVHVPR